MSGIFSAITVDAYPFHTVSWGDLTEHGVVVQDGRVRRVAELIVVRRSTKVKLAGCLGQSVELDAGSGS